MGRVEKRVVVLLAGFASACAFTTSASAQTADETCGAVSPSGAVCTGADKLAEAAAAECRRIGLPEDDCALPLGHQVSTRIVNAYRRTWLHRAAAFQFHLADGLPLVSAQWLGTHNSFNSNSAGTTASHTDSNQQLSLGQQLDIDMRSLELDVHFVPSLEAGGARAVVVCHGRGPDEQNFGCTNEPLLTQVLPEIRDWLAAHPGEVVLLYLEDELGDPAGYTQTVSALDSGLRRRDGSSMVYRPSAPEMTAKGCANLPLGISRSDVLARGAQVLLVGNCRSGWASDVYSWDDNHVESGSTADYRAFPACDATYSRAVYDSKLVRYFEDSTFVSAAVDPTESPAEAEARMLTPKRVADMTRCGVNLFGLDQILPHDGRIAASIWSWAKGQPDAGDGRCALRRGDSRWVTRPCGKAHRAACRSGDGWKLTPGRVRWGAAASKCRRAGGSFGAPRTGYDSSQLSAVAGKRRVWLAYKAR